MKPFIVGVAGGSGSCKTTIVRLLAKKLTDLKTEPLLFELDHYYRDLSLLTKEERDATNFDHPDAYDNPLIISQLDRLSKGETIDRPTYDFVTHTRKAETVKLTPRAVIIIDGIMTLRSEAMRKLIDLKIWADVAEDLRFIRRLKRDVGERGRTIESVINQYLGSVRPMHREFVEPTKRFADFVLPWEDRNENAVELLAQAICKRVIS